MLFESKDLYIESITDGDVSAVVRVYNSNADFLRKHMHTGRVTSQWVMDELDSMTKAEFTSCKVIEKGSKKIIGIMDFKVDAESYLSLLMIDSDYANRGFGKQIYKGFEDYVKSKGSNRIKLDVVTDYSDKVLRFWHRNGFRDSEDISLQWNGVILPAITMIKRV